MSSKFCSENVKFQKCWCEYLSILFHYGNFIFILKCTIILYRCMLVTTEIWNAGYWNFPSVQLWRAVRRSDDATRVRLRSSPVFLFLFAGSLIGTRNLQVSQNCSIIDFSWLVKLFILLNNDTIWLCKMIWKYLQ